jgi:hypothetical protein
VIRRRLSRVAPLLFVALAASAAGYVVSRNADELRAVLARLGWATVAGSLVLGLAGVFLVFLAWREVLHGLGTQVPVRDTSQVFFVSQLGKYLPGSVWPVLAQMEYGHRTGTARRTMLAANALTIALSVAVGLILAAGCLPFASPSALHDYWWAFAFLPPLLVLLHPRVIPGMLDWVFRRLGRPALDQTLPWAVVLRAAGWVLGSWIFFGLHLYVLVDGVGSGGGRAIAACVGGFALAVSAGLLFIPAPAGAGVRDAVLVASLSVSIGGATALAIALASRVLLVIVDLLAAAMAVILGRGRSRQERRVRR